MSCADCSFPYSLCQCPATITVGELAQLRMSRAPALQAATLDKYDPRVQAALREHLEFALDALEGGATGGPYFVLGFLYAACNLPESIQDKFRAAFAQYHEAERAKRRSA